MRRSLQEFRSIFNVHIQNISTQRADLPLKITIQIQRTDRQLEGRALLVHNKRNNPMCRRTKLSKHQMREKTQSKTMYVIVLALPNSVTKKIDQTIITTALLVYRAASLIIWKSTWKWT